MKYILRVNTLLLNAGVILLFHLNPSADTLHLSGTVQNEMNQPIEGAEVYLYTRNTIRTFTDKSGGFNLIGSTDLSSKRNSTNKSKPLILKRNNLTTYLKPIQPVTIAIYKVNGQLYFNKSIIPDKSGEVRTDLPFLCLSSGIFILQIRQNSALFTTTCAIAGNEIRTTTASSTYSNPAVSLSSDLPADFQDLLVVASTGTQTVRRAIRAPVEDNIIIKLMPAGTGYVTPGIPVYTSKGGIGDVTTYGTVNDPEYSQGGACNYGSTKIRFYAAINVNQIPGDKKGQWQDGQICGRCARVRVRTASGEERTTVVRIMDKCPDDNCGIDLGGAPAAIVMNSKAGRYSGEWEWVTCEDSDSISDGIPSLYVKTGSNEWWSLVQTRNGPGSVSEMRVRKTGTENWQSLKWATEAENFFRLPVELIQDSSAWEIEVDWSTGTKSSLKIEGKKLAIEDTLYNLD
jgi:hypothetical protein